MVILISDLVNSADTAEQGILVHAELKKSLFSGESVVVSFEGIHTATSSFVNAAFVPLISVFGLGAIQQRLRVVNSTRQINSLIKARLERVASLDA
jgi:hypothetical protein